LLGGRGSQLTLARYVNILSLASGYWLYKYWTLILSLSLKYYSPQPYNHHLDLKDYRTEPTGLEYFKHFMPKYYSPQPYKQHINLKD